MEKITITIILVNIKITIIQTIIFEFERLTLKYRNRDQNLINRPALPDYAVYFHLLCHLFTPCVCDVCVLQSAVNVTRDFEGCSTLRKYFGQLHYLQSRVPLAPGQEAAVPISWWE